MTAATPDWSEQTSLIQPRQPAFWLYVVAVLIGGWMFVDEQLSYLHYSPSSFVLSLVLLALYAVPVFLLIYYLDLFEREPLSLLLGAVLWGGLVAVSLAGPTNTAWLEIFQKVFGNDFAEDWGPAVIGPAIEETLKYLGVVVIFLIARNEIDDVFDGFVYGAMVGLGFTVVEDMSYFFNAFIANAGAASEFVAVLEGYFVRVIAGGLYTHVLFTGIAGMGLAYFVTRHDQTFGRRLAVAIGAFLVAVVAHFFWNSPVLESVLGDQPGAINWIAYDALKGLPFLLFLVLLIRLARGRERAVYRAAVAGEVGTDVLSTDDVRVLSSLRLRRAARKAVKARKGPEGEHLLGRIQQAQLNLGLISTGSSPTREADLARTRDSIRTMRAQLAAMPDIAWAGSGAASASVAATSVVASIPVEPSAAAEPSNSAPRPQSYWATGGVPMSAAAATQPQPAVPVGRGTWTPTHRVPPEGMQSWDQPDPSRRVTPLAGTLPVAVVRRVGDWAEVVASNTWTGWVDARRLVPIPGAPPALN